MIEEGRVEVNGLVVREVALRVNPDCDVIKIDGVRVVPPGRYTYLILNKPRGFVCNANPVGNQKSIYCLLPGPRPYSLKYAGRLDLDSEGLLILTDEGELVYRLTHPRFKIRKIYMVKTIGVPGQSALANLRRGVRLSDGPTLPCRVKLTRRVRGGAWFRVELFEGRKRQLRRMFGNVGYEVARLKRIAIGPTHLGSLAPGRVRPLSDKEVLRLRRAVGLIDRT